VMLGIVRGWVEERALHHGTGAIDHAGTLMRNQRLTMNGRLYRDPRGQWVYEETLFDRGRQNFYMASACHVDNAG
jgi:hypothetical protein